VGSTPAQVNKQFVSWHVASGISGGFMWLYDDMKKCPAQGTPKAYANAINTGAAS
jgi:hypothetical protein